LHVDEVTTTAKPTDTDDVDIDELNESLQDLIIEYRINEQQKAENDDDNENVGGEGDDDADDVNLQRILNQIGVSLHEKYRQKADSDQSKAKLSNMIQQLYQTLKKTQPQLFTKSSRMSRDEQQTATDTIDENEEIVDEVVEEEEEEDEQEEIVQLTPEMQRANTLFDQANKLINATTNRQYNA